MYWGATLQQPFIATIAVLIKNQQSIMDFHIELASWLVFCFIFIDFKFKIMICILQHHCIYLFFQFIAEICKCLIFMFCFLLYWNNVGVLMEVILDC